MTAPAVIGEPCGCQVLEEPDLTATEFADIHGDHVAQKVLTLNTERPPIPE